MFAVAGANLFGQWFSNHYVIERFERVTKKCAESNFDLEKAKLVLITWSYNIFQIEGVFYLSGSWLGNEKQLVPVPLPTDFPKDCTNMIMAGNDNNLVVVDAEKQLVFIMDMKHKQKPKKISLVTDDEVEEAGSTTKKNKNDQVVKVVMTNNACIYLRFINRDIKVYAGLVPRLFDTNHVMGRVIDVQCGYEHYMLLTDMGKVYTWGSGRRLQLGHGNIENVEQPREVRALAGFNIKKIRAGGWHSAVVSEFGDLYMWGWNDLGQLGIKSRGVRRKEKRDGIIEKQKRTYPISTVVDIYDEELKTVTLDVIDVCCGSKHTVVLLSDYSVWTSGSNEYGQLGLPIADYTHIEHYVKVFQGTSETVLRCGPWTTVLVN